MILHGIFQQAERNPHQIALEGLHTQLSYGQLAAEVKRLSGSLSAWSAQACVGLALDNDPAWIILDLAILAAGWSHVPIPGFFSAAQQAHALRDAGASYLLTDKSDAAAMYPGCTRVAEWLVADKTVYVFHLSAAHTGYRADKITYTSGTTGAPKGVCLSSQAMWQVAQSIQTLTQPSATDRHFCVLPLATLLENVAGVYTSLLSGATVVVYPCESVGFTGSQFDIRRLYHGLHDSRATTAILIPELLRALVTYLQAGPAPLHQLRFVAVGGAKVPAALIDQAHALHLPVYEGYGLSECASVVTLNTAQAQKPGSIGKPLPHVSLHTDLSGELWVKGAIYQGYTSQDGKFSAPVVNAEGYLATGDLAHQDADGYWYITGRKKNMFITSFGRNVSPEWVESALMHKPEILQVCVFGEARPFNVAIIVPHPQASADQINQAIEQANQSLPEYAQVSDWLRAREGFSPVNGQLTANGRLKREAIAAAYVSDINTVYEGVL